MSRQRAVKSYLVEGAVTVTIVAALAGVMLTRHTDHGASLLAVDSTRKMRAKEADGTWRDDFRDFSHWVAWAGDARATGGSVLVLSESDGNGTIVLQKQPLIYEAADIHMRVQSDGGIFSVGVAASAEGPLTELSGARDSATPAEGIALDMDFATPDGSRGQLRWMRDGAEMLEIVTQHRPLPPGEYATVDLSVGPQGCLVALNGTRAGQVQIPWPKRGYRLYLATRGGTSRVDSVALTVPPTTGSAVGAVSPGPERGRGLPLLTARAPTAFVPGRVRFGSLSRR